MSSLSIGQTKNEMKRNGANGNLIVRVTEILNESMMITSVSDMFACLKIIAVLLESPEWTSDLERVKLLVDVFSAANIRSDEFGPRQRTYVKEWYTRASKQSSALSGNKANPANPAKPLPVNQPLTPPVHTSYTSDVPIPSAKQQTNVNLTNARALIRKRSHQTTFEDFNAQEPELPAYNPLHGSTVISSEGYGGSQNGAYSVPTVGSSMQESNLQYNPSDLHHSMTAHSNGHSDVSYRAQSPSARGLPPRGGSGVGGSIYQNSQSQDNGISSVHTQRQGQGIMSFSLKGQKQDTVGYPPVARYGSGESSKSNTKSQVARDSPKKGKSSASEGSSTNLVTSRNPFEKLLGAPLFAPFCMRTDKPKSLNLDFNISVDTFRKLDTSPEGTPSAGKLRVHLRCYKQSPGALFHEWPKNLQISIRVNGNSPDKLNKRPVDISKFIKMGTNKCVISVGTCQAAEFFMTAYIVQVIPDSDLITDIGTIDITNSIQLDDDEVEQVAMKVTLKCPLSMCRIKKPVRGASCKHIQCFDLESYMMINRQKISWLCPTCNEAVSLDSLCYDEFFQQILDSVSSTVDEVEVNPDGSFQPVSKQRGGGGGGANNNSSSNAASKGASSAATGDDTDSRTKRPVDGKESIELSSSESETDDDNDGDDEGSSRKQLEKEKEKEREKEREIHMRSPTTQTRETELGELHETGTQGARLVNLSRNSASSDGIIDISDSD